MTGFNVLDSSQWGYIILNVATFLSAVGAFMRSRKNGGQVAIVDSKVDDAKQTATEVKVALNAANGSTSTSLDSLAGEITALKDIVNQMTVIVTAQSGNVKG